MGMETIKKPARYSTKEVATILGTSEVVARHFLQACGFQATKAGNCYLWDAAEVERLATTLRKPAAPAGQAVAQAV